MMTSLVRYFDLLSDWNTRMNMTRVPEEEYIERHLIDSLVALPLLRGATGPVFDIGSGAGCPGVPLAVACPHLSFTCIESQRKKTAFLENVVSQLGLENVSVVNERAEKLGHERDFREQAEVVTARAVADLSELVELALPLLRVGGHLISWKGERAPDEVARATTIIEMLGGGAPQMVPFSLSEGETTRCLVTVRKVSATLGRYPRFNRSKRSASPVRG